jgi:nicotinate phosphoribosyltransferase
MDGEVRLLAGLKKMEPLETLPGDEYCFEMAQFDFQRGSFDEPAAKQFFFRKPPFGGSYAILGGLVAFLRQLSEYRFTDGVLAHYARLGFRGPWLDFLREREKLRIHVSAPREGSLVFPHEPVVTLVGPLHDIRIAEGLLLPQMGPATLWMTKWNRLVLAANPIPAIDFGRRRAQDHRRSSLYAYLAGVESTSNAEITAFFDIPCRGTMGHEVPQAIGDEFQAFDEWLTYKPDRPVLLVDTVDSLQSGIPNALRAFAKHWDRIQETGKRPAMRIDSGDLAYIALRALQLIDNAAKTMENPALATIQVMVTGDLDEYTFTAIRRQLVEHAESFGQDSATVLSRIMAAPAGTMPATCYDQPSLGGVAKLAEVGGWASIKLSNKREKTSIPGLNASALIWGRDFDGGWTDLKSCAIFPRKHYAVRDGKLLRDGQVVQPLTLRHPDDPAKLIVLTDYLAEPREYVPYDSLTGGGFTEEWEDPTLADVRSRVRDEIGRLDWSYKRLENPHLVKVSLVPDLYDLRQRLIDRQVLREDQLHGR